jgi:hypothetical protein
MVLTGKNEIMASVFAIASNNFLEEYTDKEEETQEEEPANQPAEAITREAHDDDNSSNASEETEAASKGCSTFSKWS